MIIEKLAKEFNLNKAHVEKTVELIDEGNTIPFIARYRKEVTGGMSDTILRDLEERLTYLRGLEERKEEVIRLIDEQGKLTDELRTAIEAAQLLQRVEDLYKPFKKKRATRASKAREAGLEPLAMTISMQMEKDGTAEDFAYDFLDDERGITSVEKALQGAMDIIAEEISEDADLIEDIREKTFAMGYISTSATDDSEKSVYDMYYGKSEKLRSIPNHRVLAINRGEKEKKLKVTVEIDENIMHRIIQNKYLANRDNIFRTLMEETICDSYKRLIQPSVERETRNRLTQRAEADAVQVFAKNTESLLMAAPIPNQSVISIDPGYRTGCKVAVLNGNGKLLAYTTIYPTKPRCDIDGTCRTLKKLVEKYHTDIIVIGNGTGSRETEEVVANFIAGNNYNIKYTIVNEAGASVYSASKLADEEYPDLDVTTRGAMSLGRRLQDPLAELVKIDPKHIGVGQYQHDINQNMLNTALSNVVEDCVNRVGVDLNTASPSLLSYVAGVNLSIAKNIVAYREEYGEFKERKELLKVAKLGNKTYGQCAGFCRISAGKEPLDATSVHPESYSVAEELIAILGMDKEGLTKGGISNIDDLVTGKAGVKNLKKAVAVLAEKLNVGEPTLMDIIEELKKPGRDPRDEAPPVIFRKDVRSFEDLKEGMELSGTVRNVVDFGAFVDIGVKQDGLVHISQLADKFIKDPMEVVSVGDTVKVRIISIDKDRQKIGLTMRRK